MEVIVNVLMGAGALGAGIFCFVLSRRLGAFSTLEGGMGGAIAVLSAQVDDMTRALEAARLAAAESSRSLGAVNERAEMAAQRLELLMASLHDLPDPGGKGGDGRRRVIRAGRRDRHGPAARSVPMAQESRPEEAPGEAA